MRPSGLLVCTVTRRGLERWDCEVRYGEPAELVWLVNLIESAALRGEVSPQDVHRAGRLAALRVARKTVQPPMVLVEHG